MKLFKLFTGSDDRMIMDKKLHRRFPNQVGINTAEFKCFVQEIPIKDHKKVVVEVAEKRGVIKSTTAAKIS